MHRITEAYSYEGRWPGMPKPRTRVVFQLRFWLICAGLLFIVFIPIFRSQDFQAQRQREELNKLWQESYDETMRGERLKEQLKYAETDSFRAREARRRYGYVMPGVIRFVAEEVLGTNAVGAVGMEWGAPQAPQTVEAQDEDWSNFR